MKIIRYWLPLEVIQRVARNASYHYVHAFILHMPNIQGRRQDF